MIAPLRERLTDPNLAKLGRTLERMLSEDKNKRWSAEKTFARIPREDLPFHLYSLFDFFTTSEEYDKVARLTIDRLTILIRDEWTENDWDMGRIDEMISDAIRRLLRESYTRMMKDFSLLIGVLATKSESASNHLRSLFKRLTVSHKRDNRLKALLLYTNSQSTDLFSMSRVRHLVEKCALVYDDEVLYRAAFDALAKLIQDGTDNGMADVLGQSVIEATEAMAGDYKCDKSIRASFNYLLTAELAALPNEMFRKMQMPFRIRAALREIHDFEQHSDDAAIRWHTSTMYRICRHLAECPKERLPSLYEHVIPLARRIILANRSLDQRDHAFKSMCYFEYAVSNEQFRKDYIELFQLYAQGNPRQTRPPNSISTCLGCDDNKADVIMRKVCTDRYSQKYRTTLIRDCGYCLCGAHWCLSCLARHFLTADPLTDASTTCPTCRKKVCIQDVCFVESSDQVESSGGQPALN